MMEKRMLLRRLTLAVLLALLCALGGLWWAYLKLQASHTTLSGKLYEARSLRADLARLVTLQESLESMRADVKGLREQLLAEAGQGKTTSGQEPSGDLSPSALRRLAQMAAEQNRELSEKLATAEKNLIAMGKQHNATRTQLNQATTRLAEVQKNLTTKTTTAAGLQTKLSDLDKRFKAGTVEAAKLKGQLAKVNVERAGLLAAGKKLEERVKSLSDTESEQGTTIAALTRQLEEARTEIGKLKKQIEELRKKGPAKPKKPSS